MDLPALLRWCSLCCPSWAQPGTLCWGGGICCLVLALTRSEPGRVLGRGLSTACQPPLLPVLLRQHPAACHGFLSRPGKHLVLSTVIASPLLAGLTDAPSHYIWPPFPEFSAGLSKLKVKKYYFLVGVRAGRAEGCRAAVAAAWHPACKPLPCRPGVKRLCCCPTAMGQALLGQEETSK